uniref:Uncharacterized protein n=1 Tax=Triticum urartu TaxID=4572 RepID=A0A8R7TJ28_TRIUA
MVQILHWFLRLYSCWRQNHINGTPLLTTVAKSTTEIGVRKMVIGTHKM